jgi:hypothetical protein
MSEPLLTAPLRRAGIAMPKGRPAAAQAAARRAALAIILPALAEADKLVAGARTRAKREFARVIAEHQKRS